MFCRRRIHRIYCAVGSYPAVIYRAHVNHVQVSELSFFSENCISLAYVKNKVNTFGVMPYVRRELERLANAWKRLSQRGCM